MKTRFIGLEGFNEIESLSSTKRKTIKSVKKLNTAQKTVRFIRRLSKEIAKSIKSLYATHQAKLLNKSFSKKAFKPQLSLLDRCYLDNRTGEPSEYAASARDAITKVRMIDGRKYAHISPNCTNNGSVRKKAALATIACLVAITVPCMTATGTLDAYAYAGQSTINKKIDNKLKFTSTADEVPKNLGNDVHVAISKKLKEINSSTVGLYIDGEFVGATTDKEALDTALDNVLKDYRKDYDDGTTTEFANDVTIIDSNYKITDIFSVEEIIEKASDKFSISLSTDMVYEIKISHETKYEDDDSKSTSYSKVKTKGKDGKAKVTMRTTFIDGVQVDAIETEREVIKKAIDKVVVRGTAENSYTSYSTSSDNVSYSAGSFMWPVPYTSNITSYYGWRWGRLHAGIDIADSGVYGQAVVASDGGRVTFAGDTGDGYGYYAIIDHGNGYQTVYAHCSSLAVSAGQYVSQGDIVGYVGSTGNSTGPHLHFEIRENGVKLNPMNFF